MKLNLHTKYDLPETGKMMKPNGGSSIDYIYLLQMK